MKMRIRWSPAALAAVLLLGAAGCGARPGSETSPADPLAGAAWMDGAVLEVVVDTCRGETTSLADPGTGARLLLDVDETRRAGECAAAARGTARLAKVAAP